MNKYEAITDIEQRKLTFLEDTANFYNSTNRAVDKWGNCLYIRINNSPGCAIGRHCDNTEPLRGSVSFLFDENLAKFLPSWMIEMGEGFLSEVQNLHDTEYCWNENGLSEDGQERVNSIKTRHIKI